ncbi:MAG: hypothetical protein K5761_07050 [Clostridiales bacterium]|nr:hypothetical protein [Clostridiales bacterium]
MKIRPLMIIMTTICLFGMAGCSFSDKKIMDINLITNNNFRRAAKIVDKNGDTSKPEEFTYFKEKYYKKYFGSKGNTAQRSWRFYDTEGNLLFTFTDLGNNNLISITIDGKTSVYQYE